jgi:hypothetical protein
MVSRRRDPEPVYGRDLWDEQHLVWPVQSALMAAFHDLEDWHRRPMLTVPRDYKDPSTAGVVFWLPPWWHATAEVRKTVVSIISPRLGIEEPVATWQTAGIHPKVIIKPCKRVPAQVLFAELRDLIEAARDTGPVLGLGLGGQLVTADLEDASPHILVSAGSGGGKSALTRLIGCQALHHGAHVVICDFKGTSHNGPRDCPG